MTVLKVLVNDCHVVNHCQDQAFLGDEGIVLASPERSGLELETDLGKVGVLIAVDVVLEVILLDSVAEGAATDMRVLDFLDLDMVTKRGANEALGIPNDRVSVGGIIRKLVLFL